MTIAVCYGYIIYNFTVTYYLPQIKIKPFEVHINI